MRKKYLIKQNDILLEDLAELKRKNENLEGQIKELKNTNAALAFENEVLKNKNSQHDITEDASDYGNFKVETEIKTEDNLTITEDVDYGSSVIGKIVIEALKNSDKIQSSGNADTNELLGMINVKSEKSKFEILSICNSDTDIDIKKKMIDSVFCDTVDYFGSVLAQL